MKSEDWKKYKNWVDSENRKIDEYNDEVFLRHYPNPPEKKKFLFWEWEVKPYYMLPLPFREHMRPTVEGCLNWLLKNKNL